MNKLNYSKLCTYIAVGIPSFKAQSVLLYKSSSALVSRKLCWTLFWITSQSANCCSQVRIQLRIVPTVRAFTNRDLQKQSYIRAAMISQCFRTHYSLQQVSKRSIRYHSRIQRQHHTSTPLTLPSIATLLSTKTTNLTTPSTQQQEYKVNGYIRSVRKQKHVAFAALGDGSTIEPLQVVLNPRQAERWISAKKQTSFLSGATMTWRMGWMGS